MTNVEILDEKEAPVDTKPAKTTAEIAEEEDFHPRVFKILAGDPINEYGQRQIQLAIDMYLDLHKDEILETREKTIKALGRAKCDKIVLEWATAKKPPSSGYSKFWSAMVNNDQFKKHPRFKGNYAKVTSEDFRYFIQEGKLPE